jgi:hypothetical protein
VTRALLTLSETLMHLTLRNLYDQANFVTEEEEDLCCQKQDKCELKREMSLYVGSDFGEGSLTDSGTRRQSG